MIIHPPQLTAARSQSGRERVRLEARVECEGRRLPKTLWFEFPAEMASELSIGAEPFVVALLLLAMQRREAIEVRSEMSARLLAGLKEYQRIFHEWYPDRFHPVQIHALGERSVAPSSGERHHAAAFSGGVDSFFTFLDLKNQGKLPSRALFMAGFDMPLNLTRSIGELTQSYGALMREWGVGWIDGATNLRAFVDTVDWTNAHGPALAASALCFQGSWERFYIPSSYTLGGYPKWGTHPDLDHWLSTESLEFVHHGASFNRVRKLETLCRAPETFDRLRVCWIQDIGLKNCGKCEKCVRTQAALAVQGALVPYTTFAEGFALGKLRALPLRTSSSRLFARELVREALVRGKFGIASNLGFALIRRRIFHIRYRLFSFVRSG